jgi:formylglycine-generating enzyme required for sulfatase activity
VPGETYDRSYDGVSTGYQDQSHAASVTAFRLDKFEVTVGRFRQFVAAAVAGWRPGAGAGKHSHLNGGQGLIEVSPSGGYELGWDAAWNSALANNFADWDSGLSCDPSSASWTSQPGSNEVLPIDCVDWYEAYAFCIWDQAFLPSEAEWNDAASGGDEQRVLPWSSPPQSQVIDCGHANYYGAPGPDYCVMPPAGNVVCVGAESPAGDARWGHADLSGNVYEWTLDAFAPYVTPCPDCVYSADLPDRVIRGGGYSNDAEAMLTSRRAHDAPDSRSLSLGVRCARVP